MSSNKPFLKWAGGKRWFVQNHANLLPKEYNRYIEPFLGSGAVFFHIKPKVALLGDINCDLIKTYEAIKRNWRLVLRYLKMHNKAHNKKYYYQTRCRTPSSIFSQAAQFIYLNRTCWNGLYRVNKDGCFNVPIGSRSSVIFPNESFKDISTTLKNAKLYSRDFEFLVDKAEKGDLLFIDSPYTVRHNKNAFIKYNETLFAWEDQERLNFALQRAKNRGVKIIATNAYHKSVKKLYQKGFHMKRVDRNSSISSKSESRKRFDELVILSEL